MCLPCATGRGTERKGRPGYLCGLALLVASTDCSSPSPMCLGSGHCAQITWPYSLMVPGHLRSAGSLNFYQKGYTQMFCFLWFVFVIKFKAEDFISWRRAVRNKDFVLLNPAGVAASLHSISQWNWCHGHKLCGIVGL